MDPEVVYPPANLHSYLFSNPFYDSPINKHYDLPSVPKIPDSRVYCHDPHAKVSLTHGRLRSESLRLAQGIHDRFGQPDYHQNFGCNSVSGPVVLIQLPNSAALPVIACGFLAAGWAVTTANPANTAYELSHYIELSQPRVVITQPGDLGEKAVQEACRLAKCDVQVFVIDVNSEWKDAEKDKSVTHTFWSIFLSDKEFVIPPMTLAEADTRVAFILWTSGTTGKSKGAMLSHRAIITGVVHVRVGNPTFLEHEIWAGLPPYNHVYALFNQVLIGITIGATIIIFRKFTLNGYLSLIARYKVTLLHITPPIAVAISSTDLVYKPEYSLSSVKAIISAGAPVPPDLVKRVRDLTGVIIQSIYGMSELGPITAYYKRLTWEEAQRCLASPGPAIPPVEISIVRLDGLSTDGPANTGEIVIRSPSVMMGYLKNPETTKEMLRSDGAHSGDIGYVDETGYLYITGRLKELIKYKGFQVSPTEVEAVIADIPEVKDVAVGSIYSESQATELPMAYVVPLSNEALRIVAANAIPQVEARATNMSANNKALLPLEILAEKIERMVEEKCIYYKRLRGGIMFVSELPKSPSGKVVRLALKDLHGIFIDGYSNRKAKL